MTNAEQRCLANSRAIHVLFSVMLCLSVVGCNDELELHDRSEFMQRVENATKVKYEYSGVTYQLLEGDELFEEFFSILRVDAPRHGSRIGLTYGVLTFCFEDSDPLQLHLGGWYAEYTGPDTKVVRISIYASTIRHFFVEGRGGEAEVQDGKR